MVLGKGHFMSEVPLQVPLRHSLGGGAFMATVLVAGYEAGYG